VVLEERVECMEKFFLRAIAAGEKVDVVDHEQIDMAIAMAELVHVAGLNRRDELVDEAVATEIENPGIGKFLEHLLAGSLKEMRFAQAYAAVDEERIISRARLFADSDACGMRQSVAGTGDEIFEDVIGVEGQRGIPFVEDAAAGKIFAMEADSDQSASDGLGNAGEWLLALALAKVQLRGRRDEHLDHAIGELPGDQLVKPDAVQSRMRGTDAAQDLLPNRSIHRRDAGGVRWTPEGILARRKGGRGHGQLTAVKTDKIGEYNSPTDGFAKRRRPETKC
jgi:hypothetical protein